MRILEIEFSRIFNTKPQPVRQTAKVFCIPAPIVKDLELGNFNRNLFFLKVTFYPNSQWGTKV